MNAVLQDIANMGGVDAYWFLGDYCAIGSDPVGVLNRINCLNSATFIRGNTDRYITSDDAPPPYLEEVIGDPAAVQLYAEIARSFAWTRGMVTAGNWFDWVKALPIEYRTVLPNNTKVLLVHARPGYDDGDGLSPIDSDEWVEASFGQCDEDLIFVGHVHWPQERHVAGKHIVNPGSVGNPVAHRQACYGILSVTEQTYDVALHEVAYDVESVIKHIYSVHHPTEEYLLHFYRGQFVPNWYRHYLQRGM